MEEIRKRRKKSKGKKRNKRKKIARDEKGKR